jgi:hypothetical protein
MESTAEDDWWWAAPAAADAAAPPDAEAMAPGTGVDRALDLASFLLLEAESFVVAPPPPPRPEPECIDEPPMPDDVAPPPPAAAPPPPAAFTKPEDPVLAEDDAAELPASSARYCDAYCITAGRSSRRTEPLYSTAPEVPSLSESLSVSTIDPCAL